MSKTRVFITGTAGFIGFHLSRLLLAEGFEVCGLDGMTDYYDVRLKERRHQMLLQNADFTCHEGRLEDAELIERITGEFKPDVIVHLAAQAGCAIRSKTRGRIWKAISSARSISWKPRGSWG